MVYLLNIYICIVGKAHVYIRKYSNIFQWDYCAPEAIVRALGGKVTDIAGNALANYDAPVGIKHTTGLLATMNPESHARYLELIPDNVKEALK